MTWRDQYRKCVLKDCRADFRPKREDQRFCCPRHAVKDRVARHRKGRKSANKSRYIDNCSFHPVPLYREAVTAPIENQRISRLSEGQAKGGIPLPRKWSGVPQTWDGFEGTIRLHLHDEAPRIGCGERGLTVSVRKRRVRLLNHHTGDVGWISRDVFEKLARRAIEQDRIAPRNVVREAVTSKQLCATKTRSA
jgi:hypothetical protein